MKGLSATLWPIHSKPLPDELLSSWIVRLAHGHGLKVQTFCNLFCGNRFQVWNRDIDRLAAPWFLEKLRERTGTAPDIAWKTTLRAYEGVLFGKMRVAGQLPWILTLKTYHRTRAAFGMQFCPACLAEDHTPYFRRRWRAAFYTVCTQHETLLLDRCPYCGSPVIPHRIDMHIQESASLSETSLAMCHACRADLRGGRKSIPSSYDLQASVLLACAREAIEHGCTKSNQWDLERFAVMHQLCRILIAVSPHIHLRSFAEHSLRCPEQVLLRERMPIETRVISQRHHLLQLAAWLMDDLDNRLRLAWKAGSAIQRAAEGFSESSTWFVKSVEKLANWRNRFE
jgi:ribosomal protein L32